MSTGGNTALIFTNQSFHFEGGRGAAGGSGVPVWASNHFLESRTLRRPVSRANGSARAVHCAQVIESSQARADP